MLDVAAQLMFPDAGKDVEVAIGDGYMPTYVPKKPSAAFVAGTEVMPPLET